MFPPVEPLSWGAVQQAVTSLVAMGALCLLLNRTRSPVQDLFVRWAPPVIALMHLFFPHPRYGGIAVMVIPEVITALAWALLIRFLLPKAFPPGR